MANLHAHIMALVASSTKHNNVEQSTEERFRLVPTSLGITLSDELLAQLDRYCEANPVTPRTKKDAQPIPMPRSKAIRRAVYDLMDKHHALNRTPNQLPYVGLPPERPNNVSWTMPKSRPKDIQRLHELCAHHGIKQFVFTRKAIYLYTAANKSPDRGEAAKAASDAWF
jgi:hypothetical protein